jgi:hypothetical protein
MRTESYESSANSRTPKGKGASMHQTFFLFVTATVGLLIALALALAAFPGAAAAVPGCPDYDPRCDPEPPNPPPTVTADKAIVEVLAGCPAENTGTYSIQTENRTNIVLTSSRGPQPTKTPSDLFDGGTWKWSIVTNSLPTYSLPSRSSLMAGKRKTVRGGSCRRRRESSSSRFLLPPTGAMPHSNGVLLKLATISLSASTSLRLTT